jgi:hypothetical protein
MIVQCAKCQLYLDDEFRDTICPHHPFLANDGYNNFKVHFDAYLSETPPPNQPQPRRIRE